MSSFFFVFISHLIFPLYHRNSLLIWALCKLFNNDSINRLKSSFCFIFCRPWMRLDKNGNVMKNVREDEKKCLDAPIWDTFSATAIPSRLSNLSNNGQSYDDDNRVDGRVSSSTTICIMFICMDVWISGIISKRAGRISTVAWESPWYIYISPLYKWDRRQKNYILY